MIRSEPREEMNKYTLNNTKLYIAFFMGLGFWKGNSEDQVKLLERV